MERQPLHASTFIRSLKNGPAAQILLLLLSNPTHPVGTTDLMDATGWSKTSVSNALRLLAKENVIQNHKRYHGWLLTSHTRQLLLGETQPHTHDHTSGPEVQTLDLPPCSSSSSITKPLQNPEVPLLQTSEAQILDLPPAWQKLVPELRDNCKLPPKLSRPALHAALNRGATPDEARQLALAWHQYCQTDAANNITYPPSLIAARLADGTPPPLQPTTPTHSQRLIAGWAQHGAQT